MATDQGTEAARVREPSNAELARSYLTRELADVSEQIARSRNSQRFYETYDGPLDPGSSPNSDAGMDISDWEAERYEADNWPEEQEETLSHLHAEQRGLRDKFSNLRDLEANIRDGDINVVTMLAKRERARLRTITEQERIRRIQAEGEKFEGLDEVIDQLGELHQEASAKSGSGLLGYLTPTPNGWYGYNDPHYSWRSACAFGWTESTKAPIVVIAVDKGRSWEQEAYKSKHILSIKYVDDLTDVSTENPSDGIRNNGNGLTAFFEIDTDRRIVLRHFVVGGAKGVNKDSLMTQAHFNRFRTHLDSFSRGVKMKSAA